MTEYKVKEENAIMAIEKGYLNTTFEVRYVEIDGVRRPKIKFVRLEEEQGDIKFIGTIQRQGTEVAAAIVIFHKSEGIIDIPKSTPNIVKLTDPNGTNAQEVIFVIEG